MTPIAIGNHSALRVPRSQQARIREFYEQVLGGTITRQTPDIDFFRLGDNFYLAFLYGDDALPETDFAKATWLELVTDDVPAATQRIIDFGVTLIPSKDKTHLYFQAPGGQVFRLVQVGEDLSRFER